MSNYYEGGKTGSGVTKLLGGACEMQTEKRMSRHNEDLIRRHKERVAEAEAVRHMFSLFPRKAPIVL